MVVIVAVIVAIIAFVVIAGFIHHKIQLTKEDKLFIPNGQIVEVNGHQMHVYIEGNGEETVVFMSGGGTSSPVLDFKSLYSLLSDQYRVAVVEKAGYGFSNVTDSKRGNLY